MSNRQINSNAVFITRLPGPKDLPTFPTFAAVHGHAQAVVVVSDVAWPERKSSPRKAVLHQHQQG